MVREKLAEYAHMAWSGWMAYLFEKSVDNPDGTVTIPAWAVTRWRRQVITPYAELPENEKESDRKEADSMLQIVHGANATVGRLPYSQEKTMEELTVIEIDEIIIIEKMQEMCEESCSPEQFEEWEKLKAHLMATRKNLRAAQQD